MAKFVITEFGQRICGKIVQELNNEHIIIPRENNSSRNESKHSSSVSLMSYRESKNNLLSPFDQNKKKNSIRKKANTKSSSRLLSNILIPYNKLQPNSQTLLPTINSATSNTFFSNKMEKSINQSKDKGNMLSSEKKLYPPENLNSSHKNKQYEIDHSHNQSNSKELPLTLDFKKDPHSNQFFFPSRKSLSTGGILPNNANIGKSKSFANRSRGMCLKSNQNSSSKNSLTKDPLANQNEKLELSNDLLLDVNQINDISINISPSRVDDNSPLLKGIKFTNVNSSLLSNDMLKNTCRSQLLETNREIKRMRKTLSFIQAKQKYDETIQSLKQKLEAQNHKKAVESTRANKEFWGKFTTGSEDLNNLILLRRHSQERYKIRLKKVFDTKYGSTWDKLMVTKPINERKLFLKNSLKNISGESITNGQSHLNSQSINHMLSQNNEN